jgi:hypothetical protein
MIVMGHFRPAGTLATHHPQRIFQMVITFDFTSRMKARLSPLACAIDWNCSFIPDQVRKIDIHADYAPKRIGHFNDAILFGDVATLSSDLALCLAITTLFRPEHKEMVYEWAVANKNVFDPQTVADQMALDFKALFALNDGLVLRNYTYVAVPSERAFNEIVDALDAIE